VREWGQPQETLTDHDIQYMSVHARKFDDEKDRTLPRNLGPRSVTVRDLE